MSRATFFLRECPTCGRRLQIRVQYLGRTVRCTHCNGSFVAYDPLLGAPRPDPQYDMLQRAEQLLAQQDASRPHPK